MGEIERRRHERIQAAFEVVNVIPPLEGIGYLSDVSAGGAHLEGCTSRPPLGQRVQLVVRLPDRPAPLGLIGKVVRHTPSGFGVAFDKPCPELGPPAGKELANTPPLEQAPSPVPSASRGPRPGASPFREVYVDCCANTQWVSGRICTVPRRSLLDHLNQGDPFQRVIDCVTPHQADPLPFVALRSEAIDLLIPADSQDAIDATRRVGSFAERRIQCLLPYAVIEGTLDILDKLRISDHVMRCSAFIAMRDCRFRLASGKRTPRDLSGAPIALINVRRVLGIADLARSPSPPETSPAR